MYERRQQLLSSYGLRLQTCIFGSIGTAFLKVISSYMEVCFVCVALVFLALVLFVSKQINSRIVLKQEHR